MKSKIKRIMTFFCTISLFGFYEPMQSNTFSLSGQKVFSKKAIQKTDPSQSYCQNEEFLTSSEVDPHEFQSHLNGEDVVRTYTDIDGREFVLDNTRTDNPSLLSNDGNNSFGSATSVYDITKLTNTTYTSYSTFFSSKLDGKNDKDFYSFNLALRGDLTIEMSYIPSGHNYDLRVYKAPNTLNKYNLDFDTSYHYTSANTGNSPEKIVINDATPGTYYAVVYSPTGLAVSNSSYNLSFKANVVDSDLYPISYSVSEGRKQGDLGAIWISNYDPDGIKPMTLDSDNSRCYYYNYGSYPLITDLHDNFNGDNGKDILYSVIFIWDVPTRGLIYSLCQEMIQKIENELSSQKAQKKFWDIYCTSRDIILAAGGIVLAVIPFSSTLSTLVSMGISVGVGVYEIVTTIINALFPSDYESTLNDVEKYLINLKAAMEVNQNSTDKEVVMARFRYTFNHKLGFFKYDNYIDYHPVYHSDEGNLFGSDSINYKPYGTPFTGYIKGFKKPEDILSLVSNEK